MNGTNYPIFFPGPPRTHTGSTEMKHKLYGGVLIIGGGLAFPGVASMLQSRLELQLPVSFSRSSQSIETFANPRVRRINHEIPGYSI